MSGEVQDWNRGIGKRPRPDGTFAYVIRWSDRSGAKRTETMPLGMAYRDVKAARGERVREARIGVHHGSETIHTFVVGTFFPLKQRTLRPMTLANYEGAYRKHLDPFFGRVRLRDLRTSHVQAWVDKQTLHPGTLRFALSVLSQVCKAAVVRDLALPIDFSALSLPPNQARDYQILTLPEVYELAGVIGDWYEPDVIFLAVQGLRYSEYRALTDEDIDLRAGKLHVSRVIDPRGNVLPPKTKSGRRVIDLLAPAIEAVEQKRQQRREMGLPGGIAFPSRSGGLVGPGFYRHEWKPACHALGLVMEIRELRHTCASLLIRHGADAQYVADHLGHSNAAFTMTRYVHMFRERADEQTLRINQALEEAR